MGLTLNSTDTTPSKPHCIENIMRRYWANLIQWSNHSQYRSQLNSEISLLMEVANVGENGADILTSNPISIVGLSLTL